MGDAPIALALHPKAHDTATVHLDFIAKLKIDNDAEVRAWATRVFEQIEALE